jgi:hypothetical protein
VRNTDLYKLDDLLARLQADLPSGSIMLILPCVGWLG